MSDYGECSIGALLRFVLQCCRSWNIFCSHSGYLDVLRAMAAMLELALHLVTASIKDIKRLCRGIAASRIGCRECF